MTDEKLNVSPEEHPKPSLFDAGPEGAPAQGAPPRSPRPRRTPPSRLAANHPPRMPRRVLPAR